MTIRDLAKLAGVSRMTVSRALNNAAEVAPETRERIQSLAREHRYTGNPMITALMADVRRRKVRSDRTIIAVVPPVFQTTKWGTNHIANRLYRIGVERRAAALGFKVEDFMPSAYEGSYRRVSQVLYQRGIQAVLVPSIDVRDPPEQFEYALDWDKFAVAGIGFSLHEPKRLDRAVVAHFQSARLALHEIRERGYRRIGFGILQRINERMEGRWKAAFLLDQLEHDELGQMRLFEFDRMQGQKARLRRWLREHLPEVILGERYFLQLLLECGVKIPGDVAFVLLDWLPDDLGGDRFAGIDQRFESVGEATVDLIAGRLNRNERGLPEDPHVKKIEGRWLDGHSLPRLN
ncbi:LacI family DNA-binding transcriptional regulator [Actomonas aquatica]|uniref:LacI family DNA-binding transcriptional regulator n=2 Tax=Actomonas aquatica TaxID=2866162 RepID=A0ABZ1C848_9BACT|nr:LacI family DNA-binding transcriptional regulator [Opitutus sp. WL0086]